MLPKKKARYQLGMQDRKVPWNEIYWAWSWNLCPMWVDERGGLGSSREIINSARILFLFFLLMDKSLCVAMGQTGTRQRDEKKTKLNQHHQKKMCVTNWILMENDNMSNWIFLERMFFILSRTIEFFSYDSTLSFRFVWWSKCTEEFNNESVCVENCVGDVSTFVVKLPADA